MAEAQRESVVKLILIIADDGITAYRAFMKALVRYGHFDVLRSLEPKLDIFEAYQEIA